jgi:hypothetical protein
MPIKVYPGGAKSNVKNVYAYPGGARTKVKTAYAYPNGQRTVIYQSSNPSTEFFPFSGPYTTPGTGGNGVTFGRPPCTFPNVGVLTQTSPTPIGTNIIGLHIELQAGQTADNSAWLVVDSPGPHSAIVGRRLWLDGRECTLNGNPVSSGFIYIGAGFGAYFYVYGSFNNVQSYLTPEPNQHVVFIRDAP